MNGLHLILAHFALAATVAVPAQTVSALSAPPSREEFETLRSAAATAVQPADLSAAAASNLVTMQGFACAPGTVMPQAEAVAASAGSASTCLRSDAKLPRITRAGMATTTDASGTWSITWSAPLSVAPVTLPIPFTPAGATQPIICQPLTSTVTGATGRCWYARTLPATLTLLTNLVSYDVFGNAAPGITVQILAIPPTQ